MSETSIKRAAIINFFARYANVFLQIIYNSILARILSPSDFGVVAVISVFSSFFMLIANMGLGTAVIQHKGLTESDINSIFSVTFYTGFILMLGFIGFSIPVSAFYGNQVYRILGPILSTSLFFGTLNMIPNALLLKEKKFLLVGIRTIVVTILSGIFTIILATQGLSFYAIALHSVISAVLIFVWNRLSVRVKLVWKIDWKAFNKIRSYSAYQFAFNFMNYFSRHLDNLLIGKYLGNAALGYYDKSYRLMLYPVRNLTHVITPILHPILSDYQNDQHKIFQQYMKVVKILSVLGAFITPFCYFAAEELILIFFGPQWGAAVPSFRLLALSIWAQMITSSSGSIFQSIGQTKLLFLSGSINSILNIALITVGLLLGRIETVALLVMISYNLQLILTFIIMMRLGFHKRGLDFFKHIWKDLIIIALIGLCLYFVTPFYHGEFLLSFGLKLIVGSFVYIAGIFITNQYGLLKRILLRKKIR
jgi:PST family polysaccharide transporter